MSHVDGNALLGLFEEVFRAKFQLRSPSVWHVGMLGKSRALKRSSHLWVL